MSFLLLTKGGGSVQLTQKQEKYVQGLVAGLSQRQAYIEAGYSTNNKTNSYIDKEASLLFKNRKVFERYKILMDEHKEKALWTREQAVNDLIWLKDQALQSITNERFDKGYVRQGTSNAFLSAIQELNKLEDLYPSDKHQVEHIGQVNFVDDIN